MRLRSIIWLLLVPVCVACAIDPPSCAPPDNTPVVYVVSHGWHAELGVPVGELDPALADFTHDLFADARVLMIGYGKQTFMTAPPDTFGEYVVGPFPGPAVIQIVALNVTPDQAYASDDDTVVLIITTDQLHALNTFIWNDLTKDANGKPMLVAPSTDPAGLFYAAQSEYNLMHTCNTWTAAALHAAGLPISGDNIVFSGQVMARVTDAARHQCSQVSDLLLR